MASNCTGEDGSSVEVVALKLRLAEAAREVRRLRAETRLSPETVENLRRSEARFRLALESSGDSVWDWDLASNRVEVSGSWNQLRGIAPAIQVDDRSQWSRRIHPDDLERVSRALEDYLEGRSSEYREEYRLRRTDASYLWILDRGSAIRDDQGRATRMLGFETDISDRKRIEEALRANESRMSAIFAQAAVGLSEISSDGRFLRVNAELCRILDRPGEQLIGMKVADVTHPEDVAATEAALARLVKPGMQAAVDKRCLRPDQTFRWANNIVTRLAEEPGREAAFLAVTVDLTARMQAEQTLRASEERFRNIFEHAETGIAITHREGRIELANPSFCRLLEYTESELQQIDFPSLIHPDDRQQNLALARQLAEGEVPSFVVENRYLTKSGRTVWVRKFVSVLHTEGLGPTHFVVLVADITERRAAEEQLRQRTARLQLLSEALGQLLTTRDPEPGMHHLFSTVAEHLGTDTFLLYRPDDWDATLHLHAWGGTPAVEVEAIGTLSPGQGLCGIVAQTRRPLVVHHLQQWPDPQAAFFRNRGYQAYAGQPLVSGQRLLGTISFALRHRTSFTEDEREFIETIAQYTSVALERSRTERALAESEGRFRHMADHASVMVWVTEPDGACSFISKSWLEFTGQKSEEALGFGRMDAVHPEDRPWAIQIFERANEEQIPFSIEYRLRRADGQYRWAIDAATPRRNGQAAFLGFVGSVIDITDRKEAEERLREKEARFRALADNMAQLAWMTDETGWVSWYNKRWFDYTGATLDEMQGWGWAKVCHPDHVRRVVEKYRLALGSGENWEDTFPIRGDDGNYRWFLSRAFPIRNEHGKITRWFGTNTDITERMHAEEALRESREYLALALESAAMGVWNWNLKDNTVEWSPECYQIFKTDELAGTIEALGRCIHPDDSEVFWSAIRTALETREPYEAEIRILRQDGVTRWLANRGRARYGPDGQPDRMLGMVLDITERKNAEAALARTKEALEHANRDLDRTVAERTAELRETITELESFSYTVSHDLKAPLRAMSCFSDLLLAEHIDNLNEEGRDMLRRIAAAARRMEDLTNDLLNYTRMSQGQLHITNVQLEAVLDHVMDLYPGWREQADIHVIHPLLAVRGHPTLVGQILANLVGNAVKFVALGVRPRVNIRTEIIDAAERLHRPSPKHRHLLHQLHGNGRGGSRRFDMATMLPEAAADAACLETRPAVRIWVEDNGVGIDPQYHDKIFSIFQQLPGPETQHGTGVGLAIVAKAVERMGGHCGVESAIGQGSRFWVELEKADQG